MTKTYHHIIPAPYYYQSDSGEFSVNKETCLVIESNELLPLANQLIDYIKQKTSLRLTISHDLTISSNIIELALSSNLECDETISSSNSQVSSKTVNEAYSITVNQHKISLTALTETGLFYAIQSLLQMLSNTISEQALSDLSQQPYVIAAVKIFDQPAYAYRGMHLDVSRHFFSVSVIKRYIDLLAMHKINTFHWHLTDDQGWRIEIKKYPLLTEKGANRQSTVRSHTLDRNPEFDNNPHCGFYTQEQVRDIIDYAQQRHIMIIPEIDLPGHSTALLAAYPDMSCHGESMDVQSHFGIFQNLLCNRDNTFEFLHNILREVSDLFPSPYLHIGGDEVKTDQWKDCPDCLKIMQQNDMENYQQLQTYFIEKVIAITKQLGKKAVAWDDVFQASSVDPNILITSWLGHDKTIHALQNKNQVVITPPEFYFDFYQSNAADEPLAIHGLSPLKQVYNYQFPAPELLTQKGIDPEQIIGAQANLWTEYIDTEEKLEYMLTPRLSALSEVLWSANSRPSWDDFKRRLHCQLKRFSAMGINASYSAYKPYFKTQITNDNSQLKVDICSDFDTIDKDLCIVFSTDSDQQPKLYTQALTIDKPTIIKARSINNANGVCYGENTINVHPHKALACPVQLLAQSDKVDNADLLTNGLLGQDTLFQHKQWAAFNDGADMDVVIDLLSTKKIHQVSIGYDGATHRSLYSPTAVTVFTSQDKQNWLAIGQWQENVSENNAAANQHRATIEFAEIETRYVRVLAENNLQFFSHEDQCMQSTTLFIDEIIIN